MNDLAIQFFRNNERFSLEGDAKATEDAVMLWRISFERYGDTDAQYNYACALRQGVGIARDSLKAAQLLRDLAMKGHPWAQKSLADMLFAGEGIKPNQANAIQGWKIAAQNGIVPAFLNLANAYIYGAGVEQDVSQGMEYLHLGADAGDPQAQFSLGNRYCRGEGVERDSVRGFEYLRMAAEQGLAKAQFNAGVMLFTGVGQPESKPDFAEARLYFLRAAEQMFVPAMINLGHCYREGRGAPSRDISTALDWYRRALKQAERDGEKERIEHARRMVSVAEQELKDVK